MRSLQPRFGFAQAPAPAAFPSIHVGPMETRGPGELARYFVAIGRETITGGVTIYRNGVSCSCDHRSNNVGGPCPHKKAVKQLGLIALARKGGAL